MPSENYIPNFKSIFKDELKDFLLFKRNLGYKYGKANYTLLKSMDIFFISINLDKKIINQEISDQWILYAKTQTDDNRNRYNSMMIHFCEYLVGNGYDNIAIPDRLPKIYRKRFEPYIFSDMEITSMFGLLKKDVIDMKDIKSKDFYMLFSLYYGCGLRLMEAINLTLGNYNSDEKSISIIGAKNEVSRVIPLSVSIYTQLEKLISLKNIYEDDYIFFNDYSRLTVKHNLYERFHQLLEEVNISPRYDGRIQRIHDLRHTFCINALRKMETESFDIYTSLPILSFYLGHAHIYETEYYLRLVEKDDEDIETKTYDYIGGIYRKDSGDEKD